MRLMSKSTYKHRTFKDSLKSSFCGLVHIVKTGRNARIILTLGIMALILAYILKVKLYEFAIIMLTVALVFICEIFNTLVEDLMDLYTEEKNLKIKILKDITSGMVFLSALASLGVALVIFLPKLLRLFK